MIQVSNSPARQWLLVSFIKQRLWLQRKPSVPERLVMEGSGAPATGERSGPASPTLGPEYCGGGRPRHCRVCGSVPDLCPPDPFPPPSGTTKYLQTLPNVPQLRTSAREFSISKLTVLCGSSVTNVVSPLSSTAVQATVNCQQTDPVSRLCPEGFPLLHTQA